MRRQTLIDVQECQTVTPNSEVFTGGDPCLEVPWLFGGVTPIFVNHRDDLLAFFPGKEISLSKSLVGKIDQGEVADH